MNCADEKVDSVINNIIKLGDPYLHICSTGEYEECESSGYTSANSDILDWKEMSSTVISPDEIRNKMTDIEWSDFVKRMSSINPFLDKSPPNRPGPLVQEIIHTQDIGDEKKNIIVKQSLPNEFNKGDITLPMAQLSDVKHDTSIVEVVIDGKNEKRKVKIDTCKDLIIRDVSNVRSITVMGSIDSGYLINDGGKQMEMRNVKCYGDNLGTIIPSNPGNYLVYVTGTFNGLITLSAIRKGQNNTEIMGHITPIKSTIITVHEGYDLCAISKVDFVDSGCVIHMEPLKINNGNYDVKKQFLIAFNRGLASSLKIGV